MKKTFMLAFAIIALFVLTSYGQVLADHPPCNPALGVANGKCFFIPKSERFRITLDMDVVADFFKRGDIIQFIASENMFGNEINAMGKQGPRRLVVPKDSRIFGKVEYAAPRSPFNIEGQSRLYVFVDEIKLDSGDRIPISFVNPIMNPGTGKDKSNRKQSKYGVIDCLHDVDGTGRSRTCIRGRRPPVTISTGIVSALAAGFLAFKNDDFTTGVAVGTGVKELGSAGSVSDLVNGTHAYLKKGTVFEVEVVQDFHGVVWASAKEPEPTPSAERALVKEEEDAFVAFLQANAEASKLDLTPEERRAKKYTVAIANTAWCKKYRELKASGQTPVIARDERECRNEP